MENHSNPDTHDEHAATGLRLVHIEGFSAPTTLQDDEQEAYLRRFATIFIDESRCREGNLGQVLYGEDTWGKPVALKVMNDAVVPDPATPSSTRDLASEAFRREYETLRALSGVKGFPRLYGSGSLDGREAIIMEWVEGETLATAIRHLSIDDSGRLSPLTAAQLGRNLFGLLARMEILEDDVVHRDISTSNIMIDTSARALDEQAEAGSFDLKLVDFGSAVLPSRSSSLTQRYGAPRGATPDFAPPEMLTEDVANVSAMRKNPAVDVYAAASVLYLLLGGRTPFDLGEGEGRSYYLRKTEQLPRSLKGAHAASGRIDATLEREPQTATLVQEAMKKTGRQPSDKKLVSALSAVDEQLNEVIFACLDPIQEYRPLASEVQDSLAHFVDSYGRNVENALAEQPLSSCTDSAFERRARAANAKRSRRWSIGVGAGAVVLLLVTSLVTAVLVDASKVIVSFGPIHWSGPFNGWAIGALLWLPALCGCIARLATRNRPSSLAWTGGGVVLGTLAVLAFTLSTSFAAAAPFWLIIGALAVAAALSWFALSFDIIMARARTTPIERAQPRAA